MIAALLIGLLLTGAGVALTMRAELAGAERVFEGRVQRVTQDLSTRIQSFVLIGRSAAGLVDAKAELSRGNWLAYVERLSSGHDWRGFRGMGVAYQVLPDEERGFVARQRKQGQPAFRIWAAGGDPVPGSERRPRVPVTLMAPAGPMYDAAIGFDLASEAQREAAIAAARESAEPRMTGPVIRANDQGGRESSAILVAPIYRDGSPAAAARQSAFVGTVTLGLGLRDILDDVLRSPDVAGVSLRVIDVGTGRPLVEEFQRPESPRFSREIRMMVAGREWLLQFDTGPAFEDAISHDRSILLALASLSATLALAWTMFAQAKLRRRAEQRAFDMTAELRDSETRFRLVAEAAGEGIWYQDFRAGTEFLSPRLWEGVLGYPDAAMQTLGKFGEIVHPEDLERWREARRRHLEGGAPYEVEFRVRHGDGHWIWVRSRGQAQFDAAGKPTLMAGSMGDISERKRQAEDAERQRVFLREILDTLPEPVGVKRPAGEILIANRAYAEWMGQPLEEITGRTAYGYLPKDVVDAAVELDRQVVAEGRRGQIEVTYPDVSHAGAMRHVVISKMLCRSPDGENLIVAMHQDVTELRESETRYRELTSMASDWFWEQDAEFRFTEMSAGVRVGGRRPANVVGKCRWDLPIDWTEAQRQSHRAVLEAHEPFADMEYRVRDEAGNWRWYSITGMPRFAADGRFIGYRGTGTDITERKAVEEELRLHRDNLAAMVDQRTAELLQAKEAAEDASRAKSEFLANMSHELRTPLHAILSFAHMGQTKLDGAPAEKVQSWFGKIHGSGNRLLRLVNELLDLSRLEAGKMPIDVRPADLVGLVREVAAELEPLAEKHGLRFDLPPPGLRIVAPVDHARLVQVIHNLYSNAIKFSRAGGTITVELTEANMPAGRRASDQSARVPAWRIAVLDEGVGIPEDELEAVFDKFVQSSKTRTGAGGTGLGLAISREIIEAHRGVIRAHNLPAGGALFEILIPRGEPT